MKKVLSLLSMLLICAATYANGVVFASRPSLSPNGETIYFSYCGDIYSVPTSGGVALKVVTMGGNETSPKISPDGKYLAFSSNDQGNNNVYIVPVAGGEIKQLTFHDASDVPVGWCPQSKNIYFESNRYNTISTYSVSVEGGTPVRLFAHYFNTIANLTQNPLTGEFYFNESSESYRFATRKGYRGDHNPDIKSWNPSTKEYKELTSYRGKDIWPMVDARGNLYYVSDEKNGEANIVRHSDNKYLTSFKESIQYPSICFDGTKIVFIKGYKINVLDIQTGKTFLPSIELADNRIANKSSIPLGRPQSYSPSPDGKKLAFSFRGLLFVSDIKGSFIKQLPTPQTERVDEVLWSSDSKSLYYTRTNGGWTGIYTQKADLSLGESAVYTPESSIRSLTPSAKSDKIAFLSGGKSLMLLDLPTNKVTELSTHEFWAFQSYGLSFSHDGKYLTYTAVNLFERDVFVYDFVAARSINITNSANFENDPIFSPDGKNLYLLSNRLNSAFPRGAATQLYKVALDKVAAPFEADEYDKLFGAKGAKRDSSVVLLLENIQRRYLSVVGRGEQNSPFILSRGEKSYLLFNSNHEGDWACYVQELKEWDQKPPQKLKGVGSVSSFRSTGKDLFAMDRESLYKIDPAGVAATKVDLKFTFEKSNMDEYRQMFFEVWASLEQNFYDVKYHGVDWRAKRDYYLTFLPYVNSRDNLRTLLNDMLNELNSSHMGFSSAGKEEETLTRYVTAATGLIFSNEQPYTLERVVAGSGADYSGNPLMGGDRLVAVNGVRVNERVSREFYFTSATLPKEMVLKFARAGVEFDVKLHTIGSGDLRSLLYSEWEDWNRAKVTSMSKGKIAYVHMRDMSPESLERFIIEMNTDAVHKEALILDLRFNNGGNVHREVIDFLNQREHYRWSHRDNPKVSHPNVIPANRPLVVLINERSLSDAEVTSNGIKALKMAKLIGTETYRWIIFTSGARLVDGSSVRLPAWGCYTLEGKDLEFEGVAPDIYIRNTFKDRLESKDPQLEKAIEELLKELQK
ncbi:MAG: peptidase S41 [Bacteroidetes bacterium HGW-Bacteroidetes-5]|nr:MAG: peptidase S41 [Bacteroidetes bacterium HGW-Bacteroidetes-5]